MSNKIPATRRAPGEKKPGRPRQFDADQVLDNALALFWKYGFYSTTTRDLESALGVSQSSLYNNFGSKNAMLEAALDRYEKLTSAAVLEPMDANPDGLAAIRTFFSDLAQWVTSEGRRGCMLINMMAEDGGATDSIRQRTHRYRQRVRLSLVNSLQRASHAGQIKEKQVEQKADLLLGMVLGFNIAARGGAGKSELRQLLGAVDGQIDSWSQHH